MLMLVLCIDRMAAANHASPKKGTLPIHTNTTAAWAQRPTGNKSAVAPVVPLAKGTLPVSAWTNRNAHATSQLSPPPQAPPAETHFPSLGAPDKRTHGADKTTLVGHAHGTRGALSQDHYHSHHHHHRTDYTLVGLLDVIRMTDLDLTPLALGIDLASLGMDLTSGE